MRRLIWVIGICVIGGIAWYYFHPGDDGKAKSSGEHAGGKGGAPAPVGVVAAKTGSVNVYLNGLGNVTPRNTVTVHTRVDGELMRVLFHEGQMVKTGDLLAELDARPFEAQLEQAQGQLIRDQALLKEALIDLKRYKTLYKQDSIAKQQLDLQASLVKQYEGAVKNDQGTIDAAKVQIVYTKITAPVTGRVGLRQVDSGNIVHAADTNGIVVVTQLQPITTIFTIPEDNIPAVMEHIQNNEKLPAEAWDRDNKNMLAKGVLIAIDNQVDPTTGTVKFRAEFPNKDNRLFPSQFVNIKLRLETKEGVVLIPSAGVQHGVQGTFVYLVKPDNTVAVQPVTLGTAEGENVSIDSGLKEGDTIVVDGSDNLRDGAKIEIAAPKDTAKAEAPPPQKQDKPHKHKKHSDDE